MQSLFENQRRYRRPTASDGRCAGCVWSCIQETKSVYTTIACYVTDEKACYDLEDIQYSIFEHAS
jgi:hypothetical protein